ncbi:MAG: hypothetical protein E7070_09610 [Bacteroidales bacterium]|jgi:hypothetical protein|nr:hypothetical protein [Bacteroidales bacterium]
MKIYQQPTFKLVEIKYELIADGGQGAPMTPKSMTKAEIQNPGEAGLGGVGDEGDAAAYRGLWDEEGVILK